MLFYIFATRRLISQEILTQSISKSTSGGGPSNKNTTHFGAVFTVNEPSSCTHLSLPARTLHKRKVAIVHVRKLENLITIR
jgi:hypothetical protein